jgi:hypothetical protein
MISRERETRIADAQTPRVLESAWTRGEETGGESAAMISFAGASVGRGDDQSIKSCFRVLTSLHLAKLARD